MKLINGWRVRGAMAVVLVTFLFLIKPWAQERYEELQLFARVLNLLQQYYVEEVETKKLIYGGIKGMLRSLDPHTDFLPPEVYKDFESETAGEFGGIGIEITVVNSLLTVISPIEDTPAWQAGIKAGDKIIEIDGTSTKGMTLVEAAQKMKGRRNTKIRLTIAREGEAKPLLFTIKRGVVKIRSAKYTDMGEGLAYVRITSFIENTFKDLEKHLQDHLKKHKEFKGLIIDVRRNPGGLLDQAIAVSDLFLEEGAIVSTMGRNKKNKEVVYAKKPHTLPKFPMIVLVDGYSASASEILAGALQDNKRAIIMGQRTFGKGSVQSVVKLGDGSGLKLTVGRYYTPSGRSIQAEGIVPDIEVPDYSAEVLMQAVRDRRVRREKDIQNHLLSEEEEAEAASSKAPKKEGAGLAIWWQEQDVEDESKLSPREQLLRKDFQVLQAYNYLRSWDLIR